MKWQKHTNVPFSPLTSRIRYVLPPIYVDFPREVSWQQKKCGTVRFLCCEEPSIPQPTETFLLFSSYLGNGPQQILRTKSRKGCAATCFLLFPSVFTSLLSKLPIGWRSSSHSETPIPGKISSKTYFVRIAPVSIGMLFFLCSFWIPHPITILSFSGLSYNYDYSDYSQQASWVCWAFTWKWHIGGSWDASVFQSRWKPDCFYFPPFLIIILSLLLLWCVSSLSPESFLISTISDTLTLKEKTIGFKRTFFVDKLIPLILVWIFLRSGYSF